VSSTHELADRVVVVTGAARGLGRAIAHRLADEGAHVAVLDRDLHSYRQFESEDADMTADSTDAELRARGAQSRGYEVDLTDRAATQRVIERVEVEFGPIDALVCNAGGGSGAVQDNRAGTLSSDSLDLMLRRNLHTTVNSCVSVASTMQERRRGSIVVMSSVNGLDPMPDGNYAHYGVSKAAVLMYARYLARDLGPSGVRVNTLAPGTVPTGRLQDVWANAGQPDLSAALALRRLPELSEIADAVAFLVGDQSSYMTGQVLTIDGGRTP